MADNSRMNPLTISIVLATHNRGTVLLECLRNTVAFAGLSTQAIEIFIVDNASTDGTPQLVQTFARSSPVAIELIHLPKNQGAVAKNHGLAKARGEFCIMLDDDAYPLPGAIPAMLRHFANKPTLGAAVFDATLPDGARESSAYPDVFIGAGTAIRTALLRQVGLFPPEFFMQAEEYDLSFRILNHGYSVQRFTDMPLCHLKAPNSRIATRTTRLDVRNNLFLLAKYVPAPLCYHLAADWLQRYFLMAKERDARFSGNQPQETSHTTHFLRGAATGLAMWKHQRRGGRTLLKPPTLETIFKQQQILAALAEEVAARSIKRIALGEFGKNIYPFFSAARQLGLEVVAVLDDQLAAADGDNRNDYRGVPIVSTARADSLGVEAVVMTNISPVHGPLRTAACRRMLPMPVLNLLEKSPHQFAQRRDR